jgi:hypothetical protein
VHSPELADRGVDDPLGCVLVGEIDDEPGCLDPGTAEQRDEVVEPFVVEVGDQHTRARRSQPGGEPAPEPARRPGDDRHPPVEPEEIRRR